MSDPQGLYYEISLTNRQVLVGVLILLLCVTGAFVGGVLVGRETGPGAAAAPARAGGEGGTLDESFRFFEPEGEEAASTDSSESSEPAAQPASESRPATPVEPEQESSRSAEETAPPSLPAAQRGAEAVAERADAAAQTATGDLVIQVFSSHDETQARNILDRLRGSDVRAFLSPTEVDGRTMYRVRVGPFSERARAEAVADRLKREYRLDTWITRADS